MSQPFTERPKQVYLDEFFALKCAGDVLGVVAPLNKGAKEITESMAVIRALRPIVLKEPMKYQIWDWCAGNALTSVLAVHLLPVKGAIALDKKPRVRDWHKAKRFEYRQADIFNFSECPKPDGDSIVISVHPCTDLAPAVIGEYMSHKEYHHLIMLPCCQGSKLVPNRLPRLIDSRVSKYERWALRLAEMAGGGGDVYVDDRCLSPCNAVIVASKEKK